MKYTFKRTRSDFWINVYKNDNASYTISTFDKYVDIINYFFPMLERNSPTQWKKSGNHINMSNLWLPDGCYNQNTMNQFIKWCEEMTNDVLWLKLNNNIRKYFNAELDYCIASGFNFDYGEGRTEIGEAEYQLKYNIKNLSVIERNAYVNTIMSRMLNNCKYIPFNNGLSWCVSPMPATESGKTKMAWQMAEEISKKLSFPFIEPVLTCDKPQMKQLSIKEKIDTWEKIYYNNNIILDNQVGGKMLLWLMIYISQVQQCGNMLSF